MLFSSCGTAGRNRAGGRVRAAAGRRRAHHVGGDNESYDLVHVEGYDLVHVQIEQHAGDLSGARRIHRLPHAREGGHPCLVSKYSSATTASTSLFNTHK